ncbi:MAG: hypothetical protein NTX53_14570 [candidate division WOR-3 bacterium]|nr:hypothetical protein [candidate division WOR-3 bacterium]
MRPIILFVISLFVSAVASDTIKPLFETDSVAAYNRWLEEHRDQYPRFRPVLTKADLSTDSAAGPTRQMRRDAVVPLSELVGLQVGFRDFFEDGDHCVVYHRDGRAVTSTAYDRYGRKLFETSGYIQHRFNLWFKDTTAQDSVPEQQPWRRHDQMAESTEVLNDEGEVVGVLPGLSIQGASSHGDTLIVAVSRSGTVVFDRRARIRWRDSMFGTAARVAAISPDGRRVAVVTQDSVGLHDLLIGRNKTLGIRPGTATRFRANKVVWSDDSRHFAVYRADGHVLDTALLWTFTSDGEGAVKPRRLKANCDGRPFWMGDTVVLIESPYYTDLHWTANKQPPAGPCRVTAVPRRGRVQTWMVKGRFGEGSNWFQQGRYLASVNKSGGDVVVFQVPVK